MELEESRKEEAKREERGMSPSVEHVRAGWIWLTILSVGVWVSTSLTGVTLLFSLFAQPKRFLEDTTHDLVLYNSGLEMCHDG